MRTLDAALRYAKAGLPVLRLAGKEPTSRHGVKDATLDPDEIRHRWMGSTRWNVGVAIPEGLVVIDVDPRNGGLDSARDLGARLGGLPATPRVRTGSDGWHIWLRTRYRAKDVKATLGEGLDVKKHGGYVVMPPSLHPVTNRPYVWHTFAPVAWAPAAWARELARPPRHVTPRRAGGAGAGLDSLMPIRDREAFEQALSRLAAMPKGGRDNALFAIGAALRDGLGHLPPAAEARLIDAALASGLGASRVERTIRSIKDGNGTR